MGIIKFSMFHLSIGRGRRNSKNSTCLLGVDIGCLRMKDLSLFCLFDTPPSSLIDSIVNPKRKASKGEVVAVRSMAHITSGVEGRARVLA
jgi:hypothetical protein